MPPRRWRDLARVGHGGEQAGRGPKEDEHRAVEERCVPEKEHELPEPGDGQAARQGIVPQASSRTTYDQVDEEQKQAESEQALLGQDLQVLVVGVEHERGVLVKVSSPVSQREEAMLRFQLVQVVLTESHTEPGMPHPDQQRLQPDHDPPAARVGGPPEIHGHDDEHQRHAHDDSSNLYGRRAEQETEQRNRCQREDTRCRPGEEQAGYSSKGRQAAPTRAPALVCLAASAGYKGMANTSHAATNCGFPSVEKAAILPNACSPKSNFPGRSACAIPSSEIGRDVQNTTCANRSGKLRDHTRRWPNENSTSPSTSRL